VKRRENRSDILKYQKSLGGEGRSGTGKKGRATNLGNNERRVISRLEEGR